LFYDPTSKLSSEIENDLNKWSNPRYWRILRKQYGKSNRKRILDEVAKMMDYQEYNSSCIKDAIKCLIESKWESISGVECYVLGPMLDIALRQNSNQSNCEFEKEGPES
jgi:hypothetical protein